jgi:integrase
MPWPSPAICLCDPRRLTIRVGQHPQCTEELVGRVADRLVVDALRRLRAEHDPEPVLADLPDQLDGAPPGVDRPAQRAEQRHPRRADHSQRGRARPGPDPEDAERPALVGRRRPAVPGVGAIGGDPYYVAYVLVLSLGLRRGEALGLAWDDLNLDTGELYVAWQVQREQQKAWKEKAGKAWHGTGLVVTTRFGQAVDPRNSHRAFTARCAAAGVPVITVHTTRHTCASLLVALDVHPRVAMAILRHSAIGVTMNV